MKHTEEQLQQLWDDSVHDRLIVGSDVRLLIKTVRQQNERIEQLEKALEEIAEYDEGQYDEDYYKMKEIARDALAKEE